MVILRMQLTCTQVWEFDKNLLQNDALPLVGQYKYEIATYMRALAADEFIPFAVSRYEQRKAELSSLGSGSQGPAQHGAHASDSGRPLGITRKILRKGSKITQVTHAGGGRGGSAEIGFVRQLLRCSHACVHVRRVCYSTSLHWSC